MKCLNIFSWLVILMDLFMENKYKSYTFSQHSLSWPKFSKAFPNNPQNQQGSKVIQIFEVGFLAETTPQWCFILDDCSTTVIPAFPRFNNPSYESNFNHLTLFQPFSTVVGVLGVLGKVSGLARVQKLGWSSSLLIHQDSCKSTKFGL